MNSNEIEALEREVLKALTVSKAMPFLELTSRLGREHGAVKTVLTSLKDRGCVRLSHESDPVETIVTLSEKGFSLALQASI